MAGACEKVNKKNKGDTKCGEYIYIYIYIYSFLLGVDLLASEEKLCLLDCSNDWTEVPTSIAKRLCCVDLFVRLL